MLRWHTIGLGQSWLSVHDTGTLLMLHALPHQTHCSCPPSTCPWPVPGMGHFRAKGGCTEKPESEPSGHSSPPREDGNGWTNVPPSLPLKWKDSKTWLRGLLEVPVLEVPHGVENPDRHRGPCSRPHTSVAAFPVPFFSPGPCRQFQRSSPTPTPDPPILSRVLRTGKSKPDTSQPPSSL